MFYFSVTYKAIINGSRFETGTVGVESKANDYHPNSVKAVISDHCRQLDPSVKNVAVIITGHTRLEETEYKATKGNFVKLVNK